VLYYLYKCTPNADTSAYDYDSRLASFVATLIYILAAVTDFLDGFIARKFDMGSMVGRFIDPLADKIIVMATLVMMVYLGRVPAWFVVLLLTRELSISSLRAFASAEGLEVRVSQAGKWKTAFQMIGIIGLMTHYEYPVDWGFVSTSVDFNAVGFGLLCLAMLLSIGSAAIYFYRFAAAAVARETQV
jgi:CDP-diacylglycerol--glycerol-3-phosphate 3-phosphatidyltransferase